MSFKQRAIGFGDKGAHKESREQALEILKDTFRPEFINRIDEVIVFGGLTPEHIEKISGKLLSELQERVKAKNITLTFTKEAVELLSKEGFNAEYGARPLARTIEELVSKPLAEKMVHGDVASGNTVMVCMQGSRLCLQVAG